MAIGVLLATVALLYLVSLKADLYTWGDNAHYVAVAKSIATGRGLRSIQFPGEPPFPYPIPLFPVLLAPLVFLFDYDLRPLKLFVAATGVAAAYLSYRVFRTVADETEALLLALLSAASPQVVSFSHQVMTEVPYLALSMASLLAIVKYGRDGGWASRAGLVAAATIAAACLMKSVGVALVAAAAAWLLRDATGGRALNRKKAVFVVSAVAVVWLAVNHPILGDLAYLREMDERALRPKGAPLSALGVAVRVSRNLVEYGRVAAETVLYACYERSLPAVELAVLGLVAWGLAWSFVRRRSVLEYHAVACGAMLLAYQPSNVGNRQRYLVTLVPFALYFFWRGVQGLGLPRRPALGILALLLALNGTATVRTSVFRARPEMFDYYRFDRWAELRRMALWTRDHTPPDSVVMTTHPHVFHFWSRRRVVRYVRAPETVSDSEVLGAIAAAGASHVAVSPFRTRWSEEIRLAETVSSRPDAFTRVYQVGPEQLFERRPADPGAARRPGD